MNNEEAYKKLYENVCAKGKDSVYIGGFIKVQFNKCNRGIILCNLIRNYLRNYSY